MSAASTFNVGFKAIRRLVEDSDALGWHKAKLTENLFVGVEVEVFKWVADHLGKYHVLPSPDTLYQQFPEVKVGAAPEPPKYYTDLLDRRFTYNKINSVNLETQQLLKEDKTAVSKAEDIMRKALDEISQQRYRSRIMNLGQEAPKLVLSEYHKLNEKESKVVFGWEYMDSMTGGAMGGDVISTVGRPAAGKTWQVLYSCHKNWKRGLNVMFASMEMNHLAVAQRVAAMNAHTSVGQLKLSQYSTQTYNKFAQATVAMKNETGNFYVVDGNLAAHADDLYMLASQLDCDALYIDGAYLMRHKNPRLDRYTRVAENAELMKQRTTDIEIPTFASWQFNRDAAKKGKGAMKGQKAGLEDIGYSDVIPQVSSIVLGMSQEEGVETLNQRNIDVLKGRNGEVGQFAIHWDFMLMNFDQIAEPESEAEKHEEMMFV